MMRNWFSCVGDWIHFFNTINNEIKQKKKHPRTFAETPIEQHKNHLISKIKKKTPTLLYCQTYNFKFSWESHPLNLISSQYLCVFGIWVRKSFLWGREESTLIRNSFLKSCVLRPRSSGILCIIVLPWGIPSMQYGPEHIPSSPSHVLSDTSFFFACA